MAHDRTKRFPKLITQTPPKIGPGTYDISDLPEPKRHLGTIIKSNSRCFKILNYDMKLFPQLIAIPFSLDQKGELLLYRKMPNDYQGLARTI